MILTISRQAATNGELIARHLAEQLRCPVYDRELVDEVARRLHADPAEVARFDETTLTPIDALIVEWRASLTTRRYAHYLRAALEQISRQPCAVIIGRGANFVLHGPHVLHVRMVAPLALRVAIYRETYPVSVEDAVAALQGLDRERARFIRALYHQAIDDPAHYDLTLNLAGWPPVEAGRLILRATALRADADIAPAPTATFAQHIELMTRRRHATPNMVERERRIG
jgi:cytidylate kinase